MNNLEREVEILNDFSVRYEDIDTQIKNFRNELIDTLNNDFLNLELRESLSNNVEELDRKSRWFNKKIWTEKHNAEKDLTLAKNELHISNFDISHYFKSKR